MLNTILYADIFDYPLTKEEIKTWLIESRIKNHESRIIINNSNIIEERNGFYYLKGRQKIVGIRKRREEYAAEKLKTAKKIASYICLIPTVRLIGITGNLAINNSEKKDDIDLLIITKNDLLWTTRLLVTLLVELIGRRRRPKDKNVANKICLNMFLGEDYLSLPLDERDIFSAHEVVQMKPLFNRDLTYQKFLTENIWVNNYLPNAVKIKNAIKTPRVVARRVYPERNSPEVEKSVKSFFIILENFLKKFQLWYMRKRQTNELVKDGVIRFHPHDAREWILREYRNRLEKYQIA